VKSYFDTSVLVAAALENHPHHVPAAALLAKVRDGKVAGWVSAHGLAEFYAVLTRVPLSPPVYPSEAWQIIEHDIHPYFEVASLSGKEYLKIIENCAAAGWTGGRVYDALHVAAARKAGCDQIYTFNLRHFRELAPALGDRIRTP
jgi:predicted nucleic acid-binding protein